MQDIRKAFDSYDKDKNGTLAGKELTELGKVGFCIVCMPNADELLQDLQKLLGHAHAKDGADHWKEEAQVSSRIFLLKQILTMLSRRRCHQRHARSLS